MLNGAAFNTVMIYAKIFFYLLILNHFVYSNICKITNIDQVSMGCDLLKCLIKTLHHRFDITGL